MLAPHPCPDRSRGYAIALVSALVFSTTAIFIRHLTGRYGLAAGVLSFWRSALLVAFLASILAGIRPRLLRARRADLGFLTGLGLVLALFNLLWTTSVARCGASLAVPRRDERARRAQPLTCDSVRRSRQPLDQLCRRSQ